MNKYQAWHEGAKEMLEDENFVGEVFLWLHQGQPLKIRRPTGLKDKNGKEIYEGDILATWNNDEKFDVWDKEDFGCTHVTWDKECTCFCGTKWTWDTNNRESVYDISFVEIIGNIYEKELITDGSLNQIDSSL